MEYRIVAGTVPGKEKRVLRDLLDLFFPEDPRVEGRIVGPGRVMVYTRLPPEDAARMARLYPVRGLLNVRLVVGVYKDLEELLCRAPRDVCSLGYRVGRVRVKLRKNWRQEYYGALVEKFSKAFDDKRGREVLVEELDGKVAVEVFLFRPR